MKNKKNINSVITVIYIYIFSTSLIEKRGEVNGYSRFPIYATDAFLYNDT
jgi:hypothetical protein